MTFPQLLHLAQMSVEVGDDQCWQVCSQTKSQKLKSVLIQVCKGNEQLLQMTKNARELSPKYDWDVLANKFHEVAIGLTTSVL